MTILAIATILSSSDIATLSSVVIFCIAVATPSRNRQYTERRLTGRAVVQKVVTPLSAHSFLPTDLAVDQNVVTPLPAHSFLPTDLAVVQNVVAPLPAHSFLPSSPIGPDEAVAAAAQTAAAVDIRGLLPRRKLLRLCTWRRLSQLHSSPGGFLYLFA